MKNIFNPTIPVWLVLFLGILLLGSLLYLFIQNGILRRKIVMTLLRLSLVFVLVFTINIRYMTARRDGTAAARNIDVLFVVDNTLSMYADESIMRILHAKKACSYLMNHLKNASFSLIIFDNQAQILSPFTQDTSTLNDAFSTINSLYYYNAYGTNLQEPHQKMEELLRSSSKKENRKTVVFFLSDGEITSDEKITAYADLQEYIDGGAVLGVGTLDGARIKINTGVITDNQGNIAISKLDEDNLRQIADEMGIHYLHLKEYKDLDIIIDKILSMSEMSDVKAEAVIYDDTYYYWTVPLLVLLLLELAIFTRKKRL